MARSGRNLTAREKKLISSMSKNKIDPTLFIVISELGIDKENRRLHLRHKETGEDFEVTIPK